MRRQTVVLILILCVVLSMVSPSSFSQARRQPAPPPRIRQWQRENELRREQSRRRREEYARIREDYENEARQEALGAGPEQWEQIKPKLNRIGELRVPPSLRFSVYGFASGGSSSSGGGAGGYGGGSSSSGGASGYGAGASGGSTSYGFGSGTRPPGRRDRYTGVGNAGGAGSSAAGGTPGGAGAGPERPVKKRVGELNLGWDWRRPSQDKAPEMLTEADRTCEQLLDAIEAQDADPERVQQRIEALRRFRRQQEQELARLRRELREIVTPEQEAKLILMGYLD